MILGAIQQDIEPVEVTAGYVVASVGVAFAMLLLPLVWFCLITALAGLTMIHAISNRWMLGTYKGIALYTFGVVFGTAVVIFVIKPLFGGPSARQRAKRLKPEAEPTLFEFVDQICAAVGSPTPTSIRVSCDVNASASFRHGLFSSFSRDLVLTIGLPLVHGLTVRELAGVLAHEFGHFAQSSGMQLSYLIRSINMWLATAAYERDHWDELLVLLSHSLDRRISWILYLVRIGVWCVRLVLVLLMHIGNAISCLLARQMEYDADRHQARLAGSQVVESTLRRLSALSVAEQLALRDLEHFYAEGRLVDDLPRLIAANIDQITPELKAAIKEMDRGARTGLFDTHPATVDRVRSAMAERTSGVLQLPEGAERLRATVLFRDVDRISRVATLDLYREMLDPKLKAEKLHSVDDLIERRNAETEAAKALLRYFQVAVPEFYPFPLTEKALTPAEDLKEAAASVKSSRVAMLAALPKYRTVSERFERAEQALFESTTAVTVCDAELELQPGEFGLLRPTRECAEFRLQNAEIGVANLAAKMLDFESAAGARLTVALQLLTHPKVAKSMEGGIALREEMLKLIPTARLVSSVIGQLPDLRANCMSMVVLCSKLDPNTQTARPYEAIMDRLNRIHEQLSSLFKKLGNTPYPFDHAEENMTLRDFVLPDVPTAEEFDALLHFAQSAFERLISLQMRLFAKLAQAAEKIEDELGLPPLPDPKPA